MTLRATTIATLCLLVLASAQAARAQGERRATIESITVTAEKTETDLQSTGLSIQAYTGEQLETMTITSTEDLGSLVPGLTFVPASQNPGQLAISGRGLIHADNNPAVASTVGVYVDGVFIQSGNSSLFDLVDVQNIQFLKGPQGTLFGRNTIGGALLVETKKPTPEFGYKAKIRLGEYSRRDFFGTINVPLVGETLMARASFARTLQDGIYQNDQPDFDYPLDDDDDKTARVALRWVPSDVLTVDYAFEWYEIREHARLNPVNHVFSGGPSSDEFGRLDLAGFTTVPGNGGRTVRQTLNDFNSLDWRDDGIKTFRAGEQGEDQKRNTWNNSLTFDYEVSESAQLKLINGWHKNKMTVWGDQDGTPFAIADFGTSMQHRSFNSEVQLVGTLLDEKLDYVLGAMWWEEEYDIQNYGGVFADTTLSLASSTQNVGDSYALGYFGQATIHFTERLDLTIGLRYSTERKEIVRDLCLSGFAIDWTKDSDQSNCFGRPDQDVDENGLPDALFGAKYKERFDAWSPMARLMYHWTDDLMTYVRWSKGFAAGGFGPRSANTSDAANVPYEPEFVFSWEVGTKSTWLDNRLQLNASAFYDDYDDAQVTTFIPGQGVATKIENAGKARIRGFEFDARAVPLTGLELTLNHAWTKADFSEFVSGGVNIAGEREFAHLPKRKWTGTARYAFPAIDGVGTVEIFGLFLREGPRSSLGDKVQNTYVTSSTYTIYDGRVSLHDAFGMEGLSLAVVGKNLSDRRYILSQGIDFSPLGFTNFRVNQPRRFMFEISFDRL